MTSAKPMQLTIDEIHNVELSLLSYLDSLCNNYQLTYYLAYGTLLGAMRHDGFIPWDDDADVWMPRADYDRFLDEVEADDSHLIIKPFKKEYGFSWAKIVDSRTRYSNTKFNMPESYGLSVDIFPLDDDRGRFRYELSHIIARLRSAKWRQIKNGVESPLKRAGRRIVNTLTPESFVDQRGYALLYKVGRNTSNYYINYCSRYAYDCERMPKEWFGEGCTIKFEGLYSLRIPCQPVKVVESLYGLDWQTPVVSSHSNASVYWR